MEAKEEVRARLNIEDVIGEYVDLKRAGRNFKGLSPFGNERTPSFFVSPEKQIWHDFSSNRGGDVFSFVMEVEGMDFRQALEHLARKAGVDLSLYAKQGSKDTARKKKRFLEAHALAAHFFQHSMIQDADSLAYIFKKRGLNKRVVQDFKIGYAPDGGKRLVQFLQNKGFTANELSEAGLTNRYGGDLFRGRMAVPLMDGTGQVIGFTGRILQDIENAPKYLNTPQTLLYDKGRHVFGLSQAKEAIRSLGHVVIVEGNLDVVSSHQVDIKNVVATAGTALTEQHIKTLKRLTSDIRLAFDGDKAGLAATERAIGIASALGVNVTVITLQGDAKDPDELIQQDPALWQQSVDAAEPAVDWVIQQYYMSEDVTTAAGKRAFTTAGLALVATLSDAVERDHYEAKIATMIQSSREAIHEKARNYSLKKESSKKRMIKKTTIASERNLEVFDDILAMAMKSGDARKLIDDEVIELLPEGERRRLGQYLMTADESSSIGKDLPDMEIYVKMILLRADTRFADVSREKYLETMQGLVDKIKEEHKKQKQADLVALLQQAEADEDEDRANELRTELNTLIKEIAHGKKRR